MRSRAATGNCLLAARFLCAWVVVVALLLLGTSCHKSEPQTPPHIVLLVIDTLRADVLSTYGHSLDGAPELDALAARSVVFDRAIAACSWTRPSMGALVTGRYPRSVGLYEERNEQLHERYDTIAESLKAQGYTTLGVTANPNLNSVFNFDQGFDSYVDSTVVFKWMKRTDDGSFSSKRKLMPARSVFRRALALVDGAGEGPVYLRLDIMEMHEYRRRRLHLTRSAYRELYPEIEPVYRRRYLQALRQTSFDVAVFVEELSGRPGWENSIFVITSDHGEGLDSHPNVKDSGYHGTHLYDSNVHVPLFVYRPGDLVRNRRVKRPVRLIDVAPTILEFAGASPVETMDGVSLAGLVGNPNARVSLPEYFVTETHFRAYDKIGVHGAEWRYFENRDEVSNVGPYELQAAGGKENGQFTNAVGRQPEETRMLKAYLRAWEAAHLKVPATALDRSMSSEEEEQLEAIGYLE